MAIDSAEKRRSAGGSFLLPFMPSVTPNASKDDEWRQQAGWTYSGIPSGGISTTPWTTTVSVRNFWSTTIVADDFWSGTLVAQDFWSTAMTEDE